VLPNVSARVLVANYQPMRQYLERSLGRAVEIRTAPDFRSFSGRTLGGEFDLVVTAAHLGRLAQVQAGFTPLAVYEPPIAALLVTPKERAATSVEALRGRSLAVANPQSLVVMEGLRWLRERGLVVDRDFRLVHARNEDSLGHVLLSDGGDAPFAMLSGGELRQLPDVLQRQIKVFSNFAEVPSFVVLAHPRLGEAAARTLRARLLQMPQTDEGRRFFGLSGFTGLREPTDVELRALDGVLAQTRQLLGTGQ